MTPWDHPFSEKGPSLVRPFSLLGFCLVFYPIFDQKWSQNPSFFLPFSLLLPSLLFVPFSITFSSQILPKMFFARSYRIFLSLNYSVFYHMNSMSPFLASRQFAEKFCPVIHYFSTQNRSKIPHFLPILHPFFVFEFRHPFLYEK